MAKNRYSKKAIVKTSSDNQQILTTLAESYMSKVMEHNFDHEALEVKEHFIKLDRRWRDHARGIINRMPKLYPDSKRRINLTSTFTVMVKKLKDSSNKPINEVMGKETEFNWKEQSVENIILAFQTTFPNYKSKARTLKGLEKNYENLELDQKAMFEKCLMELVSTE